MSRWSTSHSAPLTGTVVRLAAPLIAEMLPDGGTASVWFCDCAGAASVTEVATPVGGTGSTMTLVSASSPSCRRFRGLAILMGAASAEMDCDAMTSAKTRALSNIVIFQCDGQGCT